MNFLDLHEELKNCGSVCGLFLLILVKRIIWHYMRVCREGLLLYWLLEAIGQIIEVQRSRLNNTEYLYMVGDCKL